MVDTCRLKYDKLTYSDYIHIKNSIEKIIGNKMRYDDKYNCFFTKHFKKSGIKTLIIKNQKYNDKYYYHAIELELHPVLFLRSNDYINLLKFSEMNSFVYKFNEAIKAIDNCLPDFEGWELVRIDYAVQFYTPYTSVYIDLFQRGDIPKYLIPCYDKVDHRKKQRPGSLYLKSIDNYTVNFYDKFDEFSKKHSSYENINDMQGLLRIEIQCYKRKIGNMFFNIPHHSGGISAYFDPDICKNVISEIYTTIIGNGEYLSLADAKELIDHSKLKSKNKLKEVLVLINQKRSISTAREAYNKMYNQLDNKKFNRYLERLHETGINPVTIPERIKSTISCQYLSNPFKYIFKNLERKKFNMDIYEFSELTF
jgi:hypothetical protein